MSYTVGKDIISYCGRCKLKLSHLIIALKESGQPARVQCNTCSSTRGYTVAKPKTTRKKVTRAKAIPLKEVWEKKLVELNKDPITYSIKKSFKFDDVIEHPKFGIGYVSGTLNKKIEVTFSYEVKQLIHEK